MNKEEELFKEFMTEYLNKVKEKLPESYRAQQLKAGGMCKTAVFYFEEKFLREPFMKALEKFKKRVNFS